MNFFSCFFRHHVFRLPEKYRIFDVPGSFLAGEDTVVVPVATPSLKAARSGNVSLAGVLRETPDLPGTITRS